METQSEEIKKVDGEVPEKKLAIEVEIEASEEDNFINELIIGLDNMAQGVEEQKGRIKKTVSGRITETTNCISGLIYISYVILMNT